MILFDFSQIVYGSIFNIKDEIINDGVDIAAKSLKSLIINYILGIAKKYDNEHEIVICVDYGSWRYDIHPNYKARRKIRKLADTSIDLEVIMPKIKEFEDEIKNNFPFVVVKVKNAEGDDVIGALTHYVLKNSNDKIIIVSNDKDFKQLHVSKRVVQYDYKEKREIQTVSGKNELMWLILKGDDADDIPNVRTSNLNIFVTPGVRQVRMWNEKKIWEHITNNTVFDKLLYNEEKGETDDELFENFQRNRQLIDLTLIPDEIKEKIITEYKKEKSKPKHGKIKLLQYMVKEKMINLSNRLDEFGKFYTIIDGD